MSNRCGYVAIVGRPNVGKSTLLNRVIGQKVAITSHKAQTTRHSILGIKTTEEGQIVYVDTPGIHDRADHAMNRYLNRTAKASLFEVDLIIFVVEALKWTREDEKVLNFLLKQESPVILAVNKCDQVKSKERLLPYLHEMSQRYAFEDVIPISASKGLYIETMEALAMKHMPEGANFFPDDQLSDRSERFFASELIREQLTRRYAQELPYALSVEIEEFKEEGNLYRIAAIIWVEKASQKAIIIGKNGAALKEVSKHARIGMEKFFDKKVFLQVWIKVKKSWSSDESSLSRLGYGE
ncbi:MAG: GTPase Era [Candidatus Polarisedimenticolaceae bacterium]|nr:GTPase Era [Candidatus Polarisedimenticolaceae bacterium]